MAGKLGVLSSAVVVALASIPGCEADSETGTDAECPPELVDQAVLLDEVALQLEKQIADLGASFAVACANIASDLGMSGVPDVGDGSGLTVAEIDALCTQASAAITDAINAGGAITLAVAGGLCLVDMNAQAACELDCEATSNCSQGPLAGRCPPGALWGQCSGECAATCMPPPGSPVICEGECQGGCTGSCTGTCGSDCEGHCEGICSGECSGACSLLPPSATCTGLCNGDCGGELNEPACSEPLDTICCSLPADCQCLCSALATLSVDCRQVTITVEGNAALKATLEQNLPSLYHGQEGQCPLVAKAAMCLPELDVLRAPACAELPGVELTTLFDLLVEISELCSVGPAVQASFG